MYVWSEVVDMCCCSYWQVYTKANGDFEMINSSIPPDTKDVNIIARSEDGVIQLVIPKIPLYDDRYTVRYTGTASLQGIAHALPFHG